MPCPGAGWEGVLVLLTHTARQGPTPCHPQALWQSESVSEDGQSSVTAGIVHRWKISTTTAVPRPVTPSPFTAR